jgi:prepilin-type N-terminal cleavage/methylation domain-containing protein
MSRPSFRARAGFTLVEVLVAMAVLAVIIVAVAKIVDMTSALTTMNNKHIDANGQARTVFDRMADDFGRMVKRNDLDCIFCKATGSSQGLNDTMFFFTEGDPYFDSKSFPVLAPGYTASPAGGTTSPGEKNAVALVGYRINNGSTGASPNPTYYEMERLGEALSWDGTPAINPVVFLSYPPPGTDAASVDNTGVTYSTAYFGSTIWGAYSNGSGGTPSLVGTLGNSFNDGTDNTGAAKTNPYRPLATQVFRFEISFLLKDGTQSNIPVMKPSTANALPVSNLGASQPPSHSNDSTSGGGSYAIGSRWYDTTNHIGYVCIDAAAGYAQWKEIGIKDVGAVIVTLAVIDRQGLVFVTNSGINMAKLSTALADGNDATVANTWTQSLLPPSAGSKSPFSVATGLPQEAVSQIRVYQRYFYINNF